MRMAISPCFMPLIDRLDKGAASPDLGVPSLQLGKFRCMRRQVHTEKSSGRVRWCVGLRVGHLVDLGRGTTDNCYDRSSEWSLEFARGFR